jgi:ribosomal protein L37E
VDRPHPSNNPKDNPCTRCGRPSYQVVKSYGKREFRCFPHAAPLRGAATSLRTHIWKREERYILEHIDVGFPHVTESPWRERANATREDAWGSNQLAATGPQRAGLVR